MIQTTATPGKASLRLSKDADDTSTYISTTYKYISKPLVLGLEITSQVKIKLSTGTCLKGKPFPLLRVSEGRFKMVYRLGDFSYKCYKFIAATLYDIDIINSCMTSTFMYRDNNIQ